MSLLASRINGGAKVRGVSVVGNRLREARERIGISQKQLGIKAGLDPSVAGPRINQYETGKHVPDIQTARRLADVLAVPTPYLYAEDDTLAAWILAYTQASPTMRKKITRTVTGD
jgi:transcriptional regulator with XRE-family HTH domain